MAKTRQKNTGTEQWRPLVEKWAPEFGVPVDIAMRVMRQESGGRHYTKGGGILKSSAGAMGLMQLMPGTARALGVDPANPYENLRGGLKYLGQQYKQFGDWNLAVAAYNAGPGNVRRALRKGGPDNWRAYLPRETRGYEQAIMGGKPYQGMMETSMPPAMLDDFPQEMEQLNATQDLNLQLPGVYQLKPLSELLNPTAPLDMMQAYQQLKPLSQLLSGFDDDSSLTLSLMK